MEFPAPHPWIILGIALFGLISSLTMQLIFLVHGLKEFRRHDLSTSRKKARKYLSFVYISNLTNSLLVFAVTLILFISVVMGKTINSVFWLGFVLLEAMTIHLIVFWLWISSMIVAQPFYKPAIMIIQCTCITLIFGPTMFFLFISAYPPMTQLPTTTWILFECTLFISELAKLCMSWSKYFLSERMLEIAVDYSALLAFESQAQQWREEETQLKAKFAIDSKMFEVMFSDLKIEQEIGSGGSGAVVYKATWQNLAVAVKMFKSTLLGNADFLQEFEHEVNLLASLRHNSIVTFFGACVELPRIGIVTEFCENCSLAKLVTKHKREIPWKLKLHILMDIATGLNYLHRKNIIHRDLKSDNVLLTSLNRAKISDFGISKMKEMVGQDARMTRAVGTENYMAPEVTMGHAYDEKCDVFSYAIIMYELYMGTLDVYPNNYNASYKVANSDLRPTLPSKVLEHHQWYVDLMVACWNKQSSARPTCEKIICELNKHLSTVKDDDEVLQPVVVQ